MLSEEEASVQRAALDTTPKPQLVSRTTATPVPVVSDVMLPERLKLPDDIEYPVDAAGKYDTALWYLSVGYMKYEAIPALKKALELFNILGDYGNAKTYAVLAEFLLLIENGQSEAAQIYLNAMSNNGYFEWSNIYATLDEIPIPARDDLYAYLLVRDNDYSDEAVAYSIALLDGLPVFDSPDRMIALSSSLAEPPSLENAIKNIRPRDTITKPSLPELQVEWGHFDTFPQTVPEGFHLVVDFWYPSTGVVWRIITDRRPDDRINYSMLEPEGDRLTWFMPPNSDVKNTIATTLYGFLVDHLECYVDDRDLHLIPDDGNLDPRILR